MAGKVSYRLTESLSATEILITWVHAHMFYAQKSWK